MKRLLQILATIVGLVVAWQYISPQANDPPAEPKASTAPTRNEPGWGNPVGEGRSPPVVADPGKQPPAAVEEFDEAAAQLAAEPALIDVLEDAASSDPRVREDAERFLAEHEARTR